MQNLAIQKSPKQLFQSNGFMNKQIDSPVFIHSLFRSGSTYIFNVFRQSVYGYWCYQEPLNEYLLHAKNEPERLLEISKEKGKYLRHPEMKKPYFYEFYCIADEVGKSFRKGFSYEQYFSNELKVGAELISYFKVLANGSKGRPVFQCCRTAGRVQSLKSEIGGVHVFLWRNPWDQWWSYKKDPYFDQCNILISSADNLPGYIKSIRHELGIIDCGNASVCAEFECNIKLSSVDSYKVFYALWCHAVLEAMPNCDMAISIDALSESIEYREFTIERLEQFGVSGLNFDDCSISLSVYGDDDEMFFKNVEEQVYEYLTRDGYTTSEINKLKSMTLENRRYRDINDNSCAPDIKDIFRMRELFYQSESEISAMYSKLGSVRDLLEQVEEELRIANECQFNLSNELESIKKSTIWRGSAPLRKILDFIKNVIKKNIGYVKRYLKDKPRTKHVVKVLINATTCLKGRYYVLPSNEKGYVEKYMYPKNVEDLNPSAKAIYKNLIKHIKVRKG